MANLKSEAKEVLSSFNEPSAHQELEHWEKIVFAFDMDRDQSSSSGNDHRRRAASVPNTNDTGTGIDPHDAALLAQFAAAGSTGFNNPFANVLAHGSYPPQLNPTASYYPQLFHPPPPQLPPLASLDFAWHGFPGAGPPTLSNSANPLIMSQVPSTSDPSHLFPHVAPPLQHPAQTTTHAAAQPIASSSSQTLTGPSTSSGSGTSRSRRVSSPEDLTDTDRGALAEEKRRRNTAASARFRVKKKHKTIMLERSVSDLTGRAEELEREAADLRRENGWLKEIVMLKGSRFAANNFNHRLALGQAAALATGQAILPMDLAEGSSGSRAAEHPADKAEESSDSEEEGDDEEEEEVAVSSEGKGKQRSKK